MFCLVDDITLKFNHGLRIKLSQSDFFTDQADSLLTNTPTGYIMDV